jgi:lipid-A-disaccharide synthase
MLGALQRIQSSKPGVRALMVLPNESMAPIAFWEFVRKLRLRVRLNGPPTVQSAQGMAAKLTPPLELQVGHLSEALQQTGVAIASTGTVTMECAYFGVPTVALYKTSWSTYQIGKRIVQVKFLAMPNLLANERVFPELIQNEATAENIAREALDLLNDSPRREAIRTKLREIVKSLGGPGAAQRAAQAILNLP